MRFVHATGLSRYSLWNCGEIPILSHLHRYIENREPRTQPRHKRTNEGCGRKVPGYLSLYLGRPDQRPYDLLEMIFLSPRMRDLGALYLFLFWGLSLAGSMYPQQGNILPLLVDICF